jgi:pimeloyl-ACP methyl ester carboxylesterase
MQMPFCEVSGVQIAYETSGNPSQGHTIVFVHGAASNAKRWKSQLETVGKYHYGVAVTLPGHPPSEGNYCDQIFLYREWLKEFIDIMDLSPMILAGHSMGGGIVMDYTLKYPKDVKGLLLVGTASKFRIAQERLHAIKELPYDPVASRSGFTTAMDRELLDAFIEEQSGLDPMVRYHDLIACNRWVEKGIDNIHCPCLIICGLNDMGTTPDDARVLETRISDSQLLLVGNAAHYVMMERPDVVNPQVLSFINGIR